MKMFESGRIPCDDTYIPYVRFGKGERNVFILPGLSDGLSTVEGKALLLSVPYFKFFDEFTIYMFSRRAKLPFGHSISDMADDQKKAFDYLKLQSVSLLGVSEGGMIAQMFAAKYPQITDKLVLAVTAPCINDIAMERLDSWLRSVRKKDHKALMIDTAEHSYSDKYLKKYRIIYPFIGSIGKPKDNYARFMINASAIMIFNAVDMLKNITAPTLIIGGDRDKIVGKDASYELHRYIKGSELHMYEGLGHAAYEEAKDFNDRVFSFIRG